MVKLEKNFDKTKIKRRLASEEGCLMDLKEELPLFFYAFQEACENYNSEIILTPPESRCRGFEASLFNSKLIQGIQKYFPMDWKYGKYKRFILNTKGYLILFKKLNSKGMPMNIRTKIVESISFQMMSSLFEGMNSVEEPILYFGYKKDRIGNLIHPQLVYIDENQIKWTIAESDITTREFHVLEKASETIATPKIRSTVLKAENE